MALNKDQQAVFMKVINFINGPDQFMDISGGAGTGKTFLISQIADGILKHQTTKTMHSIAITATTNKAAAVLSDAMPHRAGEIGTIYSLMNLRVSENFSTGTVKVVPTPRWIVHSRTLIIVDECSMVNNDLFKYINKGIDSTCKVLFVGDKNQLAPVKERISPIYATKMETGNLTVPVRNKDQQALMDLCEQAKQTVLTGKFTRIKEVPGVIDFVDGTQLKGILEREFLTESASKRVLSYTNSRVIQYNSFIRQLRSYTEPYEIGEILSNNSSAELLGKERLYTDQVVRVVRITDDFMDKSIVSGEEIRMIMMDVEDVNSGVTYSVTAFADHNDRENVLRFFSQNKNWEHFFKIKNGYPDLRSVSASTTHKAQGSTYDSVIVDLADIGKSTNKEQTARLQYVALSRPRSRLFIRGELPERYFT